MVNFQQQNSNPGFMPFGAAPPASVAPQGFDFEGLLKQVAGQAVQALPGLIMSLLSSHPTIGPQLKSQGVAPQSLFNFGVQTPFGGGGISLFDAAPQANGVSPQFNFGNLLKDIGGQAIKVLPGLLMGLLASHPVLGPQMKAQGVTPQSLFNIGVQTPFGGGGISMFDAAPKTNGVTPQGFDFGDLLKTVTREAVKVLPGLLMGLLSSNPVLGAQMKAQGVTPQSLFNIGVQTPFGGGGISMFDAAPSAGGVTPQGFDFGKLLQQVTDEAAKQIPGILSGLIQSLAPQSASGPH